MNFEQPPQKEKLSLAEANKQEVYEIITQIQSDKELNREYYKYACEEALSFMKNNDAEYFESKFSGTFIDKNNGMMYLLDKKGMETSLTPEQAMGQGPRTENVYKNAIKKLIEMHPEKAEQFGVAI